jgi:metal-responsive CopG/Arc/MetJ family transcriptional regulator
MFDTPFWGKMERVNIHLAVRQLSALDIISGRSGLKRAEIIRRAVDEYIDRISPDMPEVICGYTGSLGA